MKVWRLFVDCTCSRIQETIWFYKDKERALHDYRIYRQNESGANGLHYIVEKIDVIDN